MSFLSSINPAFPQLQAGQVVAYDYLHTAKTWQWTLGTVREIKDYTAVVQQWGLHTGDIDTLRSILLKEVDTENGRMKNYHDMLAIAREKLASIRRSNEDRVSHVRGHFDKAREKVELIDEVDLRKVTARAAPSPVAVAVLKAVWAVAKCDPTAVEFYEWADVQLEYRKTAALDDIAKTDVLAKLYPSAESLQQSLEQDPKLNYKAAARDSTVVASLHAWVTTALAYQQAYNLLAHDKRIQEQNDAIAAAIAGMKACRAKIAKLKDELSSKDTAALPGQVTSFTRTSVLVTIPLSAVISPVNVDSDVKGCVLTKDEVEQIRVDAKITRYTQKQKLAITASHLLDQYAAATSTHIYATELEDRLSFFQHYMASALRDAQAAAVEAHQRLAVSLQELEAFRQKRHAAQQARASDPALAAADALAPRSGKGAASPHVGAVQRQAVDPATVPVDPAVIAEEPLYVATAEELQHVRDFADQAAHDAAAREAEVADTMGNLKSELDDVGEMNAKLEGEVFALKEQLSDAEDAYKKLAGALEVAEDERQQLCDDLEAALDELEQKKDEYDELLGNLEEVQGLLEAANVAGRTAVEALEQRNRDMADLQGELANALDASNENENLRALLNAKEREIDRLKEYNSFWTDTVGTGKQKVTHRLTKIFDGDWTRLMRHRPEALKAAFVIDSSNACHVSGDQIGQVDFDHD